MDICVFNGMLTYLIKYDQSIFVAFYSNEPSHQLEHNLLVVEKTHTVKY